MKNPWTKIGKNGLLIHDFSWKAKRAQLEFCLFGGGSRHWGFAWQYGKGHEWYWGKKEPVIFLGEKPHG